MKVTFIGHASILVETSGISILSDPWWRGPCFGAQWWNYPLPNLKSLAGRRIDYIYISHGHHDHFHPGTLNTLSKSAKVLVSSNTGLGRSIRDLGFEVIEANDDEVVELAGGRVKCRIMDTHSVDTLMCIDDGSEVCVNLNDALHSAPRSVQRKFVDRLKSLYQRLDYVFCGYGVASHFPNCYAIPGKDDAATAARRQMYFNREWARLIAELRPRFGFPFAADVAFLEEDLFWINEATHNCERPTEVFQAKHGKSGAVVFDIAPGFEIENGTVKSPALRRPVRASEIRAECAAQIARANRFAEVDEASLGDILELLDKRLAERSQYLTSFNGDYRVLLRFRGSGHGIALSKAGAVLRVTRTTDDSTADYDLTYTTRLAYLKWALTRPYGDEILFVGSGGLFRYPSDRQAKRNLHRELMALLKPSESVPVQRAQDASGLLRASKSMLKRFLFLRQAEPDLYDLDEWAVRTTATVP